jgi:predicted amidohydrolase YtcJ
MCQNKKHLTRRDFLKLSAAAIGGATLACGKIQFTATLAPGAATRAVPSLAGGGFADTILVNGRIATMDAVNTLAQAIAVKDGTILKVGTDEDVLALTGETTQKIDLFGRAVTPGMIDTHCHLSAVGLYGPLYIDINPPIATTYAELQDIIADAAARTPKGEWITASGYISIEGRSPTKNDLDPVSPDHPVLLVNQGGHMGVVNSFALELAGVDASTKNPKFGLFVRDTSGDATGELINHSAIDVFRSLWPEDLVDKGTWETSVLSPQSKFASVGVTSFQDVNARGMDRMEAYFNLARQGRMDLRGYLLNTIEYAKEALNMPDEIEAIRYSDDYMVFGGFKFLLDGAGQASFTNEPHTGMAWDVPTWDPKQLNEITAAFHEAGFQCAFHAIGDAAVDMALDAIENAMNAHPRSDPRHRIEHALLNSDDALQRTKDLGVIISTQPQVLRLMGEAFRGIWGEERAQRMIPTRTWLDMGIPVTLSSDAPSLPWYEPQVTISGALLRLTGTDEVLGADQAMTIDESLRAHTIDGAYSAFEEDIKGSLEAGKMADLVVWKEDPYTTPAEELYESTIDLTMVDGKIIHQV